MLSRIKPKQQSILGIDISSSSVKIIQISSNGHEKRTIEAYGSLELPESALEGAVIKDVDLVAKIVRNVIAMSQFTTKQVVMAVPDALAISKVVQVSEGLSETDIEELVVIEGKKFIPYPIDEISIDFNVLGPSAKNSALQDVLIVASRAENVNSRVEVARLAGLEAVVIDVESYAVERAMWLIRNDLVSFGEKKVVAVIDVGAVYSHLFVLQNMKVIYSRDEQFGAKQLIEAIVQHYGLSTADATLAVLQNTSLENYQTLILQPFIEKFFIQVKRALQFFFSNSQNNLVDQIVLVGGIARQGGIAHLLQEYINIPTIIGNPIAGLNLSNKIDIDKIHRESYSLITACGLALRNVG